MNVLQNLQKLFVGYYSRGKCPGSNTWGKFPGYGLCVPYRIQPCKQFHASRRGKKLLGSSRDKNEGTYRSGEGGGGPACCCCSHINSHNQIRGHRTDSSPSETEEYPREKNTNRRWCKPISNFEGTDRCEHSMPGIVLGGLVPPPFRPTITIRPRPPATRKPCTSPVGL